MLLQRLKTKVDQKDIFSRRFIPIVFPFAKNKHLTFIKTSFDELLNSKLNNFSMHRSGLVCFAKGNGIVLYSSSI